MLDDAVYDEIIAELGHKRALAKALDEKLKRAQRARHKGPGGLLRFVEDFWSTLEPGRVFVKGWALEAICKHLEAVLDGSITRLLINISPGAMKSLLVNVFLPAYEWGPLNRPDKRYISFSYASHLTERDNQKFLDLIQSPEFKRLYGHQFELRDKGKVKVGNSRTGWKFASSVEGVGTGERGDRVCFPAEAMIATEFGRMEIGGIVRDRRQVRVWSMNVMTGQKELRPVIGWHRNPASDLVRVRLSDGGQIVCTPDHEIWTLRGWIRAAEIRPAPRRMSVSASSENASRKSEVFPRFATSNSCNSGSVDAKIPANLGAGLLYRAMVDFASKFIGKMSRAVTESAVLLAVRNVLLPCPVFEVGETGVGAIAVFMSDFLTIGARADKCQHNELMRESVDRFSGDAHSDTRVSFVQNWRKNLSGDLHNVPVAQNFSGFASHPPHIRDEVVSLESRNGKPCFVVGVEFYGHVDETFCLTVEGNHNMFSGFGQELYLVSNCLDDPHNIKDGESEAIRDRAVRFFREAMSNRLNDLSRSAIIVIMQRVNEADVSGNIIDGNLGYVHLCIPLEHEPDRHCTTYVKGKKFWTDPRKIEGESFWPERFGEAEIAECLLMGEFVYASQYAQRPEPRGGGLFKRGYWESFNKNDTPRDFKFDFILGSLDSAFTDKTRNDPSAFSVWGCFSDDHGNRAALLMHAWRKHLQLHGKCRKRRKGESLALYKDQTQQDWGLIQWVAYEVERLKANRLLIENKASGIDVSNEMERLFGKKKWVTELIDPAGLDKWARAIRVQPMFSEGLLYVPGAKKDGKFEPMKHAKLVVDEMALFDKGKYDDLTDTATQAIWWLRQNRYLILNEEYRAEAAAKARKYKQMRALYPC